jgi:molecular chaperone DnaK
LSVSDINEVILVGGMTRMPKVQESVKKFFGKDLHKGVNPDEVVSIGAAVQGGVLKGEVKDVLLLDVTPLTLGIETLGGISTPIIERNTTIPTRKSQIFSTAADNQPQVDIHVLQGERKMASDNKTIGNFSLSGIPPARKGTPQIEVTFDIDVNGILHVSAKDVGTGKEQKITITANSGLSDDEVNRMLKEAELNAQADQKKKELIELKNNADAFINQSNDLIKDNSDKISSEDRLKIEEFINNLNQSKNYDDIEKIKSDMDSLIKFTQEVGSKFYKKDDVPIEPEIVKDIKDNLNI